MCRKIIFLISYLIFSGCSADQSTYELYYQYTDPEIQKIFISELEKEGVKYSIDSDGKAWFGIGDGQRVDKIKKKILLNEFSNNAITFPGQVYIDLFKEKLTKEQIGYISKIRNGKEYVVIEVRYRDSNEVKKIIEDIKGVINRDNFERFLREKQSRTREKQSRTNKSTKGSDTNGTKLSLKN